MSSHTICARWSTSSRSTRSWRRNARKCEAGEEQPRHTTPSASVAGVTCKRTNPNRSVPRLHPLLAEAHVLDGLAFRHEVAVRHMNGAILRLNHRGVVILIRALLRRAAIQMALPFPCGALVVR